MTDKKHESFGEIVKHVDKTFDESIRLVDKNFNEIIANGKKTTAKIKTSKP